jgi:hypothetical protein
MRGRDNPNGGWTMPKVMDHTGYPKKLRSKTDAELRYTIKDAQEAQQANPTNVNCGYYADEVCYAAAELRRRGVA